MILILDPATQFVLFHKNGACHRKKEAWKINIKFVLIYLRHEKVFDNVKSHLWKGGFSYFLHLNCLLGW